MPILFHVIHAVLQSVLLVGGLSLHFAHEERHRKGSTGPSAKTIRMAIFLYVLMSGFALFIDHVAAEFLARD